MTHSNINAILVRFPVPIMDGMNILDNCFDAVL